VVEGELKKTGKDSYEIVSSIPSREKVAGSRRPIFDMAGLKWYRTE
jgi:hypothetical protein